MLPLNNLHTAPTGTHLSPQEFHSAMMDPDTVVIDVRNFNETVLGKFAPAQVLESSGEGGGEYSGWLCGVDVRHWESAECCALSYACNDGV
jgi:hypothetical protein